MMLPLQEMINQDILNDLNDLDELQNISQQQEDSLENDEEIGNNVYNIQILRDDEFLNHMKIVNNLIDQAISKQNSKLKQEQERKIIQQSNKYAGIIQQQISKCFKWTKNTYNKKFPQLESIVTVPALYCKTVRQIQLRRKGQENIFKGSFNYLTNHQRISLEIALSSIHQQLPNQILKELLNLTQSTCLLQQHLNALLMYLESCMQIIAPNLCQLVGCLTASKLVTAAGGLKELAAMPSCNIQVLGGQRSAQLGLSNLQRNHTGLFGQMDIVRDAPPNYQMQLVRMFAANTAKCARADILKSNKNLGIRLRQQMNERFEKIQQQGGLHRIDKPLPVPDLQPKKKRGGKRHRKNKQMLQMSELRKQQNRLKFGTQAQQQIADGIGLGMIKGSEKLKVAIKKKKLNVSKKMDQRINKKSGLQSSLNLGAASGIQLINPNQKPTQSGSSSIFNKSAGFQTVLNNKFGTFK